MRKVAFPPIYFIQKGRYRTHILRSSLFHYNNGEVCFFPDKNTWNAIKITYAKMKTNSRSRFFKPQSARASLNYIYYIKVEHFARLIRTTHENTLLFIVNTMFINFNMERHSCLMIMIIKL